MKRYFIFCIVLVLCCSSVFALPRKGATSQPTEPAEVEETSQNNSVETLTEVMPESENSWTELSEKIDDKFFVTGNTLKELKEAFVQLGSDIEALKADNRSLNDELSKSKGSKFLSEIELLFGYNEGIRLGAGMSMGMRVKDGLLLKTGVSYMGIDPMNIKSFAFDTTAVFGKVSIGWEW